MFRSQQRKTKILFGLSDVVLTALAFEFAYLLRQLLHLERQFYLLPETRMLLLGYCMLTWVAVGYWLNFYAKLDAARISVILRDSTRQVGYSSLALFVFLAFGLRLD